MQDFISNLEITLEKKKGTITEKDIFRNYPEWDSLMVFAVLSMISDEYDVTIGRAEFDELVTVEDLYNIVMTRK
ncbi:MAG: acyl carrier protein [Candidatus Cloacimonas sp.]|jgi:acyl carrier protein|nr:acyl carrier protein [Candidatus Cloacimonas sp.]HOJ16528.1 acyl carrier protein [Caldisericia bacterium]HQM17484.1 acyl carrier protein [Candidatus Cloacimonas sp.]